MVTLAGVVSKQVRGCHIRLYVVRVSALTATALNYKTRGLFFGVTSQRR